jgi:hypothetical protein
MIVNSIILFSLSVIDAEVYHMLSTNLSNPRIIKSVEQPQTVNKLTLNTPVVLILYIILNMCDSGCIFASRWRTRLRLLCLGWSSDGHSPYSAQVLQPSSGGC